MYRRYHRQQTEMITYASDCSGIGAPETALTRLGVQFRYAFASEIDKHARLVLETAPHPPERIYHDVTQRDPAAAESVDLYVAGFCCQSFSGLGHMRAFDDPRGQVFYSIHKYIEHSQPATFVLENVHSIITQSKGAVWNTILDSLKSITEPDTGEPVYNIEYRVLSPHQFGFPQSRQRVFIVGRNIKKMGYDALTRYPFPEPTAPPTRDALAAVLMPDEQAKRLEPMCGRRLTACSEDKLRIIKQKLTARGDTWSHCSPHIVDPHTSAARIRLGMPHASLCLTTRCNEFYLLGRDRYLTSFECLRLQGYRDGELEPSVLLESTPRTQRFKMAGNSMDVNLMERLLRPLVDMLHHREAPS